MRPVLRFLLSHHHPEHEHRCVHFLGRPVCARCLGMYPLLLVGLVVLLSLDAAVGLDLGPWPQEGLILMAMVAPALFDWFRGRLRPSSGSNTVRLVTGALLGLGLARTIHLHAQAPFQKPAIDVILLLVVGAVTGELVARALATGETSAPDKGSMKTVDPDGSSNVESSESPESSPDDRSEHG